METSMVHLIINGIHTETSPGTKIIDAAKACGIEIPSLCYIEGLDAFGGCRLCMVQITHNGVSAMRQACAEPCAEGMVIETEAAEVVEFRQNILRLLLSDHLQSCFSCANHDGCKTRQSQLCAYDKNCFTCGRRDGCKLRAYALKYGVYKSGYETHLWPVEENVSLTWFRYNANRCIRCRRCQRICEHTHGESRIQILNRGRQTVMSFPEDTRCADCMKCVELCPTGALRATQEN